MSVATFAYGLSDVGRKRQGNEDALHIDQASGVYLVADGMGGHNAGEVASAHALEVIAEQLTGHPALRLLAKTPSPQAALTAQAAVEQAFQKACAEVYRLARADEQRSGMGTTAVGLFAAGNRAVIGHVGDSRIYLLRAGKLHRLTEDHTLIAAQIKAGTLTPEEAARSPYRNVITRAVGIQESVQVDTLVVELLPGDRFLLCTDGLHGYLSDDEIPELLGPPVEEAPRRLIELANSRGGRDNITALVFGVEGDPASEAVAEAEGRMKALRQLTLFKHLDYKELTAVLAISSLRAYGPGRDIVVEKEVGDELFVVVRGRVLILCEGVEIAELSVGGHFGEMGLIDTVPRSATVRAAEPTRVVVVKRKDLLALMRREPMLAVKLLWSFVQVLSDRLRAANAEMAETRQDLAEAEIARVRNEERS